MSVTSDNDYGASYSSYVKKLWVYFLIICRVSELFHKLQRVYKSFSAEHLITDPSDQRWQSFRGAVRSQAEPTEDTELGRWKGRRNSCGRTDCGGSTRTQAWWWRPDWETLSWQTRL